MSAARVTVGVPSREHPNESTPGRQESTGSLFDEPLIDTVVVRNVLGDITRVDGTSVPRCEAVYRRSTPTLVESVIYDGWVWTLEKYSDGSRRLYATGPSGETSPFDGYPLSPREYLEDVEGIPERVVDALARTWIPRVRASAAQRALHWAWGEGGQNIAPVLVIDRGAPGNTYAAVFSDGSAISPEGYAVDDWADVVAGIDAPTAAELLVSDVKPSHEGLADDVRRAIGEAAAR